VLFLESGDLNQQRHIIAYHHGSGVRNNCAISPVLAVISHFFCDG